MSNYSLELSFIKPSEEELPGPAISQVFIQEYSQDNDGTVLITPRCRNFEELDSQVERLKKELDDIRERGRVMYTAFPK